METEVIFFGPASGMGAGCRVGTCLPGSLGTPVFLRYLAGNLSRGRACVPLASHEGKHTERKVIKERKS